MHKLDPRANNTSEQRYGGEGTERVLEGSRLGWFGRHLFTSASSMAITRGEQPVGGSFAQLSDL